MTQTIRIVAHVKAYPGKEECLKSILLDLIQPTRDEESCLHYELLQSTAMPNEFVFLEEWTDNLSIHAHLESDHMEEAFLEAAEFLAEPPEIRWYKLLA